MDHLLIFVFLCGVALCLVRWSPRCVSTRNALPNPPKRPAKAGYKSILLALCRTRRCRRRPAERRRSACSSWYFYQHPSRLWFATMIAACLARILSISYCIIFTSATCAFYLALSASVGCVLWIAKEIKPIFRPRKMRRDKECVKWFYFAASLFLLMLDTAAAAPFESNSFSGMPSFPMAFAGGFAAQSFRPNSILQHQRKLLNAQMARVFTAHNRLCQELMLGALNHSTVNQLSVDSMKKSILDQLQIHANILTGGLHTNQQTASPRAPTAEEPTPVTEPRWPRKRGRKTSIVSKDHDSSLKQTAIDFCMDGQCRSP